MIYGSTWSILIIENTVLLKQLISCYTEVNMVEFHSQDEYILCDEVKETADRTGE